MRQHHALGLARRSRRVDDRGHVVRLHRQRVRAELGRARRRVTGGPAVLELLERHVGMRRRSLVEDDDRLERGQLAANRCELPGLRFGRYEDRDAPRVSQWIAKLLGREARVQRNVGDAARQAGEIGDRPLGSVLREDGHAIARPDPQRGETVGHVAGTLEQCPVRDRLVLFAYAHLHGVRLVPFLDRFEQQLIQRAGFGARSTARVHRLRVHVRRDGRRCGGSGGCHVRGLG